MRAFIWAGWRPMIETRSAAVPVTCGAAMLVPCAPTMNRGDEKQRMNRLVWLHAAHTKTSLPAGAARAGSGGVEAVVAPRGRSVLRRTPGGRVECGGGDGGQRA